MLGRLAKADLLIWMARFLVIYAFLGMSHLKAGAESNVIDVRELSDKPLLELKGPWDFFWAEWLEPGDERPAMNQQMAARTWIPDPSSTFAMGQGYATYRLTLKNIQARADGYSFVIRSASAALKLQIYPKHKPQNVRMATAGRPGLNAKQEIPQLRAVALRFFPEAGEDEWVVLVHMSNFHYGRGGLWTSPLLGYGSSAEARLVSDREFLLFCLGMILVIGVYNIVLFARRPADKPTLMLAIFCVVVSLRSFVTDNLIGWYFPQLDVRVYQTKYLIEYMTMVVGPLSCISFVHFSFLSSSVPRLYRGIVNISLLSGLLIITLDPYYRSLVLSYIQIVTLLQVAFGLLVLVRAVLQRREEALLAATGGIILSVCVVYDVLVTFNVFSQPYITSLGMSVFVFMQSQLVAHRFAKAFGVAEHLSHKLKDEVELQTLEIRSIMENIPQGVFIMLDDHTIQGNYSRELEQLLGETQLARKRALPILFRNTDLTDEDRSIVDSILLSVFHEPIFAWELNAHSLPQELLRQGDDGTLQVFEVEWHPIINRQALIDRVLVTLRNVTEIKNLQASQRKDQQAFALLLEIVQVVPDRFRDFMQQSWDILRQAQRDIQKMEVEFGLTQRKVLMRLHTWKGLSRSLGFKNLAARIHEVEQTVSKMNSSHALEMKAEVESLIEKLRAYENVEKERLGRTDSGSLALAASVETKRLLQAWYRYQEQPLELNREALHQAVADYIKTLPEVTLAQLIQSLKGEITSLALDLQKPEPILEGRGLMERPMPEPLYKSLSYVLQHLIRNSMDHGLESPDERKAQGKAPAGRIIIEFSIRDGYLQMDYSDDGRGLDLKRVLKKAKVLGLVDDQQVAHADTLSQLIFAPGFSTKGEIDLISGHGIGMDAVRLLVEESGGSIGLILNDPASQHPPFHLQARWDLSALTSQVA